MGEPTTRTRLYAAFQIARNALMEEMAKAGEKPEAIAKAVSLTPLQVYLILRHAQDMESPPSAAST